MASWALINHQSKVVSGSVLFTRLLELLARLRQRALTSLEIVGVWMSKPNFLISYQECNVSET
jgi:hypothetical protein